MQAYDVTEALVEGENVLGLALADGWWAGRLGLTGSSAQFGTRLSAIWQLHLDYVDGTTEIVASGADARSATGPWAYADLFVGEQFDRRAMPTGWNSAGFDDGEWMPVAEVGRDHSTLRPFTGEPIRRVHELAAAGVIETTEGAIVDFGQVIAGRVRLRFADTTPGQRVVIEHTETLAADGSWFDNIVGINKEQTDVFIAAGGADEWEPEFTFHGFRYARVSGLSGPLDPADIVAVVIASDLEQTGSFSASDHRLDRLHQNAVWSQRGNFVSIPTDCPQREKVGWTGDIQAFVGAASNNAQIVPFLSRWLDNLRADQLPDGRIPIFSPRSPFDAEAAEKAQGIGSIVAATGWSDAIAIVPWTLYERYGDRRVLEENYDAMLRWIEYQRTTAAAELPESLAIADLPDQRRSAQALLYNTGAHFGDWLTPSTMEGRPTHEAIGIAPALTSEYIAPMFQAHTLTIAARVAAVLGRPADAADLAARAAAVRAAFAAEYVDAHGDLPVRLQGVYVLALAFEMVPRRPRPDGCAARRAGARARRPPRHRVPLDAVPPRCAVGPRIPRCGSDSSVAVGHAVMALRGRPRRDDLLGVVGRDLARRQHPADVVQPLRTGRRRRLAVSPRRRHPLDLAGLSHRRDRAGSRDRRRPRAGSRRHTVRSARSGVDADGGFGIRRRRGAHGVEAVLVTGGVVVALEPGRSAHSVGL